MPLLIGLPLIIASHVIFSAYGFWLPNDPRGSWSKFVGAYELFLAGGKATTVTSRRSLAAEPHDAKLRHTAKSKLQRPAVRFTGQQAVAIGRAFGDFATRNDVTVQACAVMPDHVHMVIARHRYDVEQLVSLLKGAATRRLIDNELHPFLPIKVDGHRVPTCWARGEWKVFLDSPADVSRAIRYVEMNPIRQQLKRQYWSFVSGAQRRPLP